MQTENLANNSHKQFYVLLNTNQIKLYTYPDLLKENSSLRNFLNSESTAYFLDETFYHTYTYTTSSIIHMTATKYSIMSTEKCSYLTWLVVLKRTIYIST